MTELPAAAWQTVTRPAAWQTVTEPATWQAVTQPAAGWPAAEIPALQGPAVLEPFFRWCESTFLGTAVRDSVWAFPILEAVHLLGLCVLGGALLVVDLRMLGLGLTAQPVARLARYARPWLVASLVLMAATGIPLFLSEAIKAYYNTSFWVKMATLPVALGFTFAVRERVARREGLAPGLRCRIIGAVSLALWFTVAAAGRWIGFS